MNSRSYQKYHRYHRWWSKIEKRIIVIAILLFLVLYAVQLVNFVIQQRGTSLLSKEVETMEDKEVKTVAQSQTQLNTGTIELTANGPQFAELQIFINGEYYGNFSREKISLMVKNNDIIEVSGIKSQFPANITVSDKSHNVKQPKLHDSIQVDGSFAIAGKVVLE